MTSARTTALFAVIIAALLMCAVVAANAQEKCIPHRDALAYFLKDHGERPIANAVMENGVVIEILAKPDGATWTMLALRPDGKACLVASGSDWRVQAGKS